MRYSVDLGSWGKALWVAAAAASIACHFDAGLDPSSDDPDADPSDPQQDAGQMLDGSAVDAAPRPTAVNQLDGRQWLLPCTTPIGVNNCNCDQATETFDLDSGSGRTFEVTIRVRGALEPMTYTGGTAMGNWYIGGNPGDGANNVYRLQISEPAQHYWINHGPTGPNYSLLHDFTATIQIVEGARVELFSSGQDGVQWSNVDENLDPIVIPGVTTTPEPYDGQFAQMNVVSFSEL